MKLNKALLPRGLKDLLPVEAEELNRIKEGLSGSFSSWGYMPVQTPAFEFYGVLAQQTGELIQKEMFKLFDSDGELLALKPEMTTPLARMACQKYSKSPLPLRFSYISDVFRQELPRRGQQRQFTQAGIEMIGKGGSIADAEVICLAIETLQKLGLKKFYINVGQMGIIEGLLDKFNSTDSKLIREALLNKNLAMVAAIENNIAGPKKIVSALNDVLGCKKTDDLKKLNSVTMPQKSTVGLKNLVQVLDVVKRKGYAGFVEPDLTMLNNFEYYTGIVFEIYAGGIGFPIGSGGRYDNLLIRFGRNLPAAGFAFGVERLHIALSRNNVKFDKQGNKTVLFGDKARDLFLKAGDLRAAGFDTAILEDANLREAASYAKEYGFDKVLQLRKGKLYAYSLEGKSLGGWSP